MSLSKDEVSDAILKALTEDISCAFMGTEEESVKYCWKHNARVPVEAEYCHGNKSCIKNRPDC